MGGAAGAWFALRHATLVVLAILFWPIQGTTHAWVWVALALAAIGSDWRRGPPLLWA